MPSRQPWRDRFPVFMWYAVLGGLVLWVASRLGVFSLSQLVDTGDGPQWLPSAFASVDHPFHIARAETLRRALLDGDLLRWIPHHQGGYPVEFYPLGAAWLDVAVWGLSFGALSIPQAHTIAVALIFLAPGIAYLAMARADGWSPRVAVLALALHIVIPGDWWHGGYTELVQWGLVTNVAGAVAALFFLAWLSRYVASGHGREAAIAALAAAFAVYANPRSLIALAVVGLGVGIAAVVRPGGDRPAAVQVAGRVGLVALLAMLLAAPELISLARFSQLYQFVRYEWYASFGDYLQLAVTAVSAPVFVLGLIGVALVIGTGAHVAARAAAVTLLLYALVTILLLGELAGILTQLEPTRLMPFQRLLTVYLAAVAVEMILRWLTGRLGRYTAQAADVMVVVLIGALVVARSNPGAEAMPIPGQTDPMAPALYQVARAAVPEHGDFREAIELADAEAAPGTALLVIGTALSWHQRLWAPLWTDRQLLYDNWLWFWHDDHAGAPGYVWSQGHHYPDPSLALDPGYLAHHGIGAVVVTGPATVFAAQEPALEPVRTGTYRVFTVRDPTTIVTIADANAERSSLSASNVVASGSGDGETATIRRNWFPRWQASVNGEPVPIMRMEDGYMSVPVPRGPVTLELRYVTDGVDWLARILAAFGLLVTIAIAVGRRPRRLASIARRTGPADSAHGRD